MSITQGASGHRITLLIPNMHCPSCVERITSLLSPMPLIRDLDISLLQHTITFTIDPSASVSSSSSFQQRTTGEVLRDVKRELSVEGGFWVDDEDGSMLPLSTPRSDIKRKSRRQWMGLPWLSGRGEEEKCEEDRRKRHLAHCQVCQTEEKQGMQYGRHDKDDQAKGPIAKQSFAGQAADKAGHDRLLQRTLVSISGMTCASCSSNIGNALRADGRVISANVNLLESSGTIVHSSDLTDSEIIQTIEDLGYDTELVSFTVEQIDTPASAQARAVSKAEPTGSVKTTFSIEGMTCASCSNAISTALRPLEGIQKINIDILRNSAVIVHSSSLSVEKIAEAVEDVGYGASEVLSEPISISSTLTNSTSGAGFGSGDSDGDGFRQIEFRTVQVRVNGMYCHECVNKLNSSLPLMPLQSHTPFSLKSPISRITYDPRKISIRVILRKLEDLAPEFEAGLVKARSVTERSREIRARELRVLAVHLGVAVVFAIPTFLVAVVGMILLPDDNIFQHALMAPKWGAANTGTLVLWPLATVIQFGVGRLFYSRSLGPTWRSLKRSFLRFLHHDVQNIGKAESRWSWRSFFHFGSMDLLVSLSTSVAYFSSIAMLILDVRSTHGTSSLGTYFDSSVFLIMFILLGRVLEAYAKSRTTDAVGLLGQLRPETALLVEHPSHVLNPIDDDGCEPEDTEVGSGVSEENLERRAISPKSSSSDPPEKNHVFQSYGRSTTAIPVDHLEKGDLILIPPGSLPCTDGIIIHGATTFDESSLTGESKPVNKTPGDTIFTGTTNLSSAIVIRATALPSETMLDGIMTAVSDAATHKAPIEKLAERLTGVFVPVIIYLSLVVLVVWLSLSLTGRVSANSTSGETENAGGRVFWAIEFAISTLVVACPCGIGLAVPCANAVGNGLAAKIGILAGGGGEAFLAATKVGAVVFDKTGTLTEGKCRVTDEKAWSRSDFSTIATQGSTGSADEYQDLRIDEVERAVMEVEKGSTHPLAKGLVEHLGNKLEPIFRSISESRPLKRPISVVSSKELPGRGLECQIQFGESKHEDLEGVNKLELLIGNAALLKDHGVELDESSRQLLEKWSREAKSVVLVAIRQASANSISASHSPCLPGYELHHAYALADPPRSSAKTIISKIQKEGIEVYILSGDNPHTARAMARMVGVKDKNVHAGVSPIQKAEMIEQIRSTILPRPSTWDKIRPFIVRKQREEREQPQSNSSEHGRAKVMFVGDGLNDAVALAAADVSVAMGHGSQAVLAGSDFVLLSSSLDSLPALFALSSKVYTRQRLNLLWAILFNFVCIPFAAGAFYPLGLRLTPVWSAVLMAASSVSVVLSSLAMKWGM